jgi:hypothetical protein
VCPGERSTDAAVLKRVLAVGQLGDNGTNWNFDISSSKTKTRKNKSTPPTNLSVSPFLRHPRLLPQPATWRQRHPARQLCVFLLENKLETERK